MEIIKSIIGTILFVIFVLPIILMVAVFIAFSGFMGIFIPLRFIFSKKHLEECGLKHKGVTAGFWHFVDTRANLLSFDLMGSKPLKKSPNYIPWIKANLTELERQLTEAPSYERTIPGYTQYILDRILELKAELA